MDKKQNTRKISFWLTDDAYWFPDESEPAECAHVFGPASSRPQPYHILDAKEHNEAYFLWRKNTDNIKCCVFKFSKNTQVII